MLVFVYKVWLKSVRKYMFSIWLFYRQIWEPPTTSGIVDGEPADQMEFS